MSTPKKRGKRRKQAPLQRDDLQPRFHYVEEPPQSWRDTLAKVNADLMRAVTNLIGLFPDVLDCARTVVRGVPRLLSKKVSVKVGEAHLEADATEADKQQAIEAPGYSRLDVEKVGEALADLLHRMQAKGIHVNIVEIDGRLVVVAVQPELAEVALEVAKQATPEPKAQPTAGPSISPASHVDDIQASGGI